MSKRVFLIVLDSVGIGEMPDADEYGDKGSNTLKAVSFSKKFSMPNMKKLGLFNIDGVDIGEKEENPLGVFARLAEVSKGKDTTTGHWEMAGIQSKRPMPTYPNGFPKEVLDEFSKAVGRGVVCNMPYSGTEVIKKYGQEHIKTGKLIVYTSADSVFQIAAHENVIPVNTLYEYCKKARNILQGEHGVGRVIARPFEGIYPNYVRTKNRHDFSLCPPEITMLNQLENNCMDVIGIGKIKDIFAGNGITEYTYTQGNEDGINKTIEYMKKDFNGLCFINLVDYDMLYGHRNDVDGYANALTEFDKRLPEILKLLKDDDILMITADHGCDPSTSSTDHSREYVPFIMYSPSMKEGRNLNTRNTFSDIGATILDYFGIKPQIPGTSMLKS